MRYICSFVWSFWFYHHIRWYLPFSVLLPGVCLVISLFRHTAGHNIIFFSFLAKSYSIECMLHIYFIVHLWMDNFFCVCDALAIVNSASKHWGACLLNDFFLWIYATQRWSCQILWWSFLALHAIVSNLYYHQDWSKVLLIEQTLWCLLWVHFWMISARDTSWRLVFFKDGEENLALEIGF